MPYRNLTLPLKCILLILGLSFWLSGVLFASDYRIHSFYSKGLENWINIVITKKINKDLLIKICKDIHRQHPNSFVNFYDEASKIKTMTLADKYYLSGNYPYPEKWAQNHYIGILNKMMQPNR